MKIKKTAALFVFTVMIAAICLSAAFAGTVAGAEKVYYLCLESDGYNIRQSNTMVYNGEEYVLNITLDGGEKLLVRDSDGLWYGDAKGNPVRITEKTSVKYTAAFKPDGFADGSRLKTEYYSPEEFYISVNGELSPLPVNPYVTDYEQYVTAAELNTGDVLTVQSKSGVVYGLKGEAGEGINFTVDGMYRIVFTADSEHLFGTDKDEYIAYSAVPELVLTDGGENSEDGPQLVRDESVTAYAEYYTEVNIPDKNYEYTYAVYDKESGERYYPSPDKSFTADDKGVWKVVYSPEFVYSVDSGDSYHTRLKWVRNTGYTSDYDGYYLLGDTNGWQFPLYGDEEFDSLYQLKRVSENRDFEEYTLKFEVSSAYLNDKDFEFYITDGEKLYRTPAGRNIKITRPGVYELKFSPSHNYGNTYSYTLTLTGEEPEPEEIRIGTAEEFEAFLQNCSDSDYSLNKEFVLTADIDLKDKEISPAPVFSGIFDGCFHSIKGIKIILKSDTGGLFNCILAKGEILRLTVNADIDGKNYSEVGLAGINKGRISDTNVYGTIKGGTYTGALAGRNEGDIISCANYATVRGLANTGGITGENTGSVADSRNYGGINTLSVSTSEANSMINTGGIAGYSSGTLKNCFNSASVGKIQQGRNTGGIAGLASGGIYFCFNSGAVNGYSYAGGVAGYLGALTAERSALEDLLGGTGGGSWLDGYFESENDGQAAFTLSYCGSTEESSVKAYSYSGGVAGYAGALSGTVKNSFAAGSTESLSDYAGGICGRHSEGSITGCITSGNIKAARDYAGGIAGHSSSLIADCASSSVISGRDYIGGIAGLGKDITGCYTNVKLLPEGVKIGSVAGFADISADTVEYNYFTGEYKGINGVNYGSGENNAAVSLSSGELASEGALSVFLTGFGSDSWIGGKTLQYPVPRKLTECEDETGIPGFAEMFSQNADILTRAAYEYSKITYTVTFFKWDGEDGFVADITLRVYEGSGLSGADFPENSEYGGYYVWWPDTDLSCITGNTEIYELYDDYLTTLSLENGKVLLEGRFYSDTQAELVRTGEYYSIKLRRQNTETALGEVTVKWLAERKNPEVYIISGGDIRQADFSESGSYIAFSLKEGESFYVTYPEKNNFDFVTFICSFAGGALVASAVFAIVFYAVKKKRGKSE